MKTIFITGGDGFIGTNFIKYSLKNNLFGKIINLDKQTYAAKGNNLKYSKIKEDSRYNSIKGDIGDNQLVKKIFKKYSPNLLINFAAESHVDNSIKNANPFIETNVKGTLNLLENAKEYGTLDKFIQIGTDEIYGSLKNDSPSSIETDPLDPRSPYSASKASSDLLALSYFYTHNLPVIVTRSSNNFGPFQFPEKFLPLFITNLIDKKQVPLMWSEENPGLDIRDWLHVEDNARGIYLISQKGNPGEIYNIAGENEKPNIEIVKMLLENFNIGEEMIKKIPHRKGHDFRYSINAEKLKSLGFEHKRNNLEKEILGLCEWYAQNKKWWRPLKK